MLDMLLETPLVEISFFRGAHLLHWTTIGGQACLVFHCGGRSPLSASLSTTPQLHSGSKLVGEIVASQWLYFTSGVTQWSFLSDSTLAFAQTLWLNHRVETNARG